MDLRGGDASRKDRRKEHVEFATRSQPDALGSRGTYATPREKREERIQERPGQQPNVSAPHQSRGLSRLQCKSKPLASKLPFRRVRSRLVNFVRTFLDQGATGFCRRKALRSGIERIARHMARSSYARPRSQRSLEAGRILGDVQAPDG